MILGVSRSVARLVVLAVSGSAALLAMAYHVEPLGSWWLELAQYAPYPVYLLPALLALVLSLLLGRVWRVAALLGLGLVVTVIMGLAWGSADHGSGRVRVMTYNVKAYLLRHQAQAFTLLEQEVAQHAPDILVMQDAGELTELRRQQPATAASIYAGRHIYAFGQYVVVSRYPLRDCRPGDMSFRGQGHTFVKCTVAAEGVEFDLLTAHLLSPRGGLNATRRDPAEGVKEWQQNFADRLAQATRVAAVAGALARPLVVAGDLNAPESSPVVRSLLARGLRDAFSAGGRGYGYTHGHALRLRAVFEDSFLRIDHILVSPEIGVLDCFAGGKEASEHRPVIADLLLRRDPR